METSGPPFFVGGPIPTALASRYLHGYEEERRTITQLLHKNKPQLVGVLGAPQSGKTSLILAASPDLPEPRAHVECGRLWPSTATAFTARLREALGSRPARPEAGRTPAEALMAVPMPRRTSPGVLVLENADRLADIDPGLPAALAVLAGRIPDHLVLTGERERLDTLVDHAVRLEAFSEATAHDLIRRRFTQAGMAVDPSALPVFTEFGRGQPETLSRIGLAVWEEVTRQGRLRVETGDVDAAIGSLVDHLPTRLLTQWAQVRGIMRDVFIAMCLHDLVAPTEIARRLDLEPKNVVVLLGRLASVHRLIDRVDRGMYRVRDPLLKHYVRKEFGTPILR